MLRHSAKELSMLDGGPSTVLGRTQSSQRSASRVRMGVESHGGGSAVQCASRWTPAFNHGGCNRRGTPADSLADGSASCECDGLIRIRREYQTRIHPLHFHLSLGSIAAHSFTRTFTARQPSWQHQPLPLTHRPPRHPCWIARWQRTPMSSAPSIPTRSGWLRAA